MNHRDLAESSSLITRRLAARPCPARLFKHSCATVNGRSLARAIWPHLGHNTRSVSSMFGGIWRDKGMRHRTNEIYRKFGTHGAAVFFADLRKDVAGSRWLLSKIAGGPHAATSIWNGINKLGLVASWCDPGPRHHRKSPIPKDSSPLLRHICRPVG